MYQTIDRFKTSNQNCVIFARGVGFRKRLDIFYILTTNIDGKMQWPVLWKLKIIKNNQWPNSLSLTVGNSWLRHRVVVPDCYTMYPGEPERQPYAGIKFILPVRDYEFLATVLLVLPFVSWKPKQCNYNYTNCRNGNNCLTSCMKISRAKFTAIWLSYWKLLPRCKKQI